jgi:hypothetical protein
LKNLILQNNENDCPKFETISKQKMGCVIFLKQKMISPNHFIFGWKSKFSFCQRQLKPIETEMQHLNGLHTYMLISFFSFSNF